MSESYSTVLADLEAIATSTGPSGVSSSQADSLNLLLQNVASADGTGSYVYSILDNVVLAGGQAGTPATSLTALIGQWFLGTDDPVPLPGTHMVSQTNALLFPANITNAYQFVDQGYNNGDCWLVAAIDETDAVDSAALASMIWENANGTFGVRFCSPTGYTYLTVNSDLMSDQESAFSTNGTVWAGLLEKAFVEAEADGITFSMEGAPTYGNDYQTVSNGGYDEMMLAMTGRATSHYGLSDKAALTAGGGIYQKILSDITSGLDVIFASNVDTTYGLVSNHMFAVIGVDQTTGNYIFFNPWGYAETKTTQFEVTPAELYALRQSGDEFLAADGASYVTESALCHLAGTAIRTPEGERPIESLRIGDAVMTRFGGVQRIKWIGEQHYAGRFIAANRDKIPVRIAAEAFGAALPRRDLFLSPGHSILLNDFLIVVRDLVNGITVTQGPPPDMVSYYNIELETHDCVLAEGLWSETYADCAGQRASFHNAASYAALYPARPAPAEPELCAPRPRSGPAFNAILARILSLAESQIKPGPTLGYVEQIGAEVTGWAWDPENPDLPVLLHIYAGHTPIGQCFAHEERRDVRAADHGAGRSGFRFTLPAHHYPASITVRRAATGAILPAADTLILHRRAG